MKSKHKKTVMLIAIILGIIIIIAILNPLLFMHILAYKILFFKVYHVLWIAIVLVMIAAFFPRSQLDIGSGKMFAKNYSENKIKISTKEEKLRDFTKKMDLGAVRSVLFWGIILIIIGLLYYSEVINQVGLIIITLLFGALGLFFALVWCPFRNWLIKNRCCNTCRIYNWGYLMTFSPLVFISSFWTYSLVALAAVIFIQWEYLHHKHPERFYELYNSNLMCKNCSLECKHRRANS
ncbi:MAG: hypothetical protein ABIE94_05680 [archaeon]